MATTSPSMIPGGNRFDVVNGTVRPSRSELPCWSRASAPTNSVYVCSAWSESPRTSVSRRPLHRRCLILSDGAISTATEAVRGSMPSLNSTEIRGVRLTPVAAESGVTDSTVGGSTSGGPPKGGSLRAQPAARRSDRTASADRRRQRRVRSGTWMGLLVGPLESFSRNVRVHLRARQRCVSQELLDRAQVRAGIQQMARERVAERVRRHAQAGGEAGARASAPPANSGSSRGPAVRPAAAR